MKIKFRVVDQKLESSFFYGRQGPSGKGMLDCALLKQLQSLHRTSAPSLSCSITVMPALIICSPWFSYSLGHA